MMCIVIISILATLLLTAVTSAMRTAKNAAVGADLNTLAQALASFKEKHGDYPPSRVLLAENGHYPPTLLTDDMVPSANGAGSTDITMAALGRRSIASLRKFWPRLALASGLNSVPPASITTTNWYDYNGNGVFDAAPYILEGDECLTFFLGGVPLSTDGGVSQWSMSGLGKVPTNPFSNNLDNGNAMFSGNRTPPHFEFKNERLRDPDADPATDNVRFPAYFDVLGTEAPIVYFSAYGGENYDPNDCNMPEMDDAGAAMLRLFRVKFPVTDTSGTPGPLTFSAPPNPYSASDASPVPTKAAPTRALTVQWQKPQSFQLISAGRDGVYGHGGQYAGSGTTKLPENPAAEVRPDPSPARSISRPRETDNITSFAAGPLE